MDLTIGNVIYVYVLIKKILPKNNKSGCKGVYWAKDKQKWTVQ